MSELEEFLERAVLESRLVGLFVHQKTDVVNASIRHARMSVSANFFRIRKFELWERSEGLTFRIFHSPDISQDVREALCQIQSSVGFARTTSAGAYDGYRLNRN